MEEARAKFWTNIAAAINKSKSFKSDTKRDTREIKRYWKLTYTEMEASIYYLLAGRRVLRKILRATEMDKARDRSESLVRNID